MFNINNNLASKLSITYVINRGNKLIASINSTHNNNNNNKMGFTLIEIVVVMVLLALLAALVIPRVRRTLPLNQKFTHELNMLARTARTHAWTTGKTQRIFFDLKKRVVKLEEKKSDQKFEPISLLHTKISYKLDKRAKIEQFFINNKPHMSQGDDLTYTNAWIFIDQTGLMQDVRIIIRDTQAGTVFSVRSNPFTAQFSVE